jgi:hypothetical protein
VNDGRDVNERQPPRDQGVLLADDGSEILVEVERHRNVDPVNGENGIRQRKIFGSGLRNLVGGFMLIFDDNGENGILRRKTFGSDLRRLAGGFLFILDDNEEKWI